MSLLVIHSYGVSLFSSFYVPARIVNKTPRLWLHRIVTNDFNDLRCAGLNFVIQRCLDMVAIESTVVAQSSKDPEYFCACFVLVAADRV